MANSTATGQALFVIRCVTAGGVIFLSSTVILFILLHKRLRKSPTNRLVLSLAVSDLLTGSVYFPLYILNMHEVLAYLVVIILNSGVFNIAGITYDSYTAVFKPFRYHLIMPRRYRQIIIACWISSIVMTLPPLIYKNEPKPGLKHKIYIICLLLLGVVLPNCYICVTYFLMFRRIRKKRRILLCLTNFNATPSRLRQLKEKRRITVVFGVTAVNLALTWLPLFYMTMAGTVFENISIIPYFLLDVSNLAILISSFVNPLIYGFMKPDIYFVMKRKLRCTSRILNTFRSNHVAPLSSISSTSTDTEISIPLQTMRVDEGKYQLCRSRYRFQFQVG